MDPVTRFRAGAALITLLLIPGTVHGQAWVQQGPGPNTLGQVEGITDGEVTGAIHCVAAHPADANILYVGAVNGGIWRTGNATAAKPSWVPQLGLDQALSIGDIAFDPTDPTHLTLIAGAGHSSSFSDRPGGGRVGVWRTTNGTDWTLLDGGGTIVGRNITGVAARGATIVVSADAAGTGPGIWRSIDTGGSFVQISGMGMSGLPAGAAFDLAEDPSNPARLFTNAGANGIYRSDDTGLTWMKKSNADIDNVLAAGVSHVEISVGTTGNVYVAIVAPDGPVDDRLTAVFRSPDGGDTWAALDLPTTAEMGGPFGIHPGGQGDVHLSIAADLTDENIVYIGGDRQARHNDGMPGALFPNTIGAATSSGRLFRINASQAPGSQSAHITHSNTTSNSSPHADSRDMALDANGDLIEVDDGGIYRRTTPKLNTGDWISLNGDLKVTELHDAAWDSVSDIIISGAQDTGTPQQTVTAGPLWASVSTADGGDVAVDDTGTPGVSTRYSSNQNLGFFRRRTYGPANNFMTQVLPALTVVGGGDPLVKQFTTPVVLNNVDPTRLIIGGSNSVYESLDQGDTITEIGVGIKVNARGREPIAYGAAGNADMLYIGFEDDVLIRDAAAPDPLVASATYPGSGSGRFVAGIAIDPADPEIAFVVDTQRVYRTDDAGTSWNEITGNLAALNPGTLLTIAYSTANVGGSLVVGAFNGVFVARGPGFVNWTRLGTGLPKAPVYDLEYDATDQVLVAGLLGRGAWTIALEERDPVDVALVLDLSGSMLSPACPACDPKLQVLKDAVEIFVQLWTEFDVPGDRMAVNYFRTDVQELTPGGMALFPIETNADALIVDVQGQNTVPTNLTAMGGGLQTAINLLSDAARPRSIILFTDGMQNVNPMVSPTTFEIADEPGRPASGVAATVPPTDLNAALERKVNTIGVGATAPFVDLLSQIANETGGVFKLTTAPDDDLRQFYVEQLVDVLRDFSPQLIGYRHGALAGNEAVEEFTTNATARKVVLKVSSKRGTALDFTVEKDGQPLSAGKFITGPFYKIFSIDVPGTDKLGQPVTAAGQWRVRISGRQGSRYEVAAIADEAELKYDFAIGGTGHTTGTPLPLSVKLTFAGQPVTDANVTARVLAPKVGLGTLLATARTPANLQAINYEPQATDAQRKYQLLLSDDAFRARLQPQERSITLQHAGGGTYTATYDATAFAGPYTAVFNVAGSRADIGTYARTESHTVTVRFGQAVLRLSNLQLAILGRGDPGRRVELRLRPVDANGNLLGPDYGDRIALFVNGTRVAARPRDLLDGTYVFTFDVPEPVSAANVTVTVLEQPLYEGPLAGIPSAGGGRVALSAHLGSTIPVTGFPGHADDGYLAEIDLEYRITPAFSIEGVIGHYDFGSAGALNGFTLYAKKYLPGPAWRWYGALGPGVFRPEGGGGSEWGGSFAAGLSYAITPRMEFDAGAVYTHIFSEDFGWLGLRAGVKVTF